MQTTNHRRVWLQGFCIHRGLSYTISLASNYKKATSRSTTANSASSMITVLFSTLKTTINLPGRRASSPTSAIRITDRRSKDSNCASHSNSSLRRLSRDTNGARSSTAPVYQCESRDALLVRVVAVQVHARATGRRRSDGPRDRPGVAGGTAVDDAHPRGFLEFA